MNTKQFGSLFVGILALVLVMSAVSAAIVLNPTTSSVSVAQGSSGTFTFTIQNDDATSVYSSFTAVASNLTSGTNVIASSNVVVGTLPSSLNAGNTSSAITVTISTPSSQTTGTYTGTIVVDASGTTSDPNAKTMNVSVTVTAPSTPTEITSCSTTGNPGQLDVRKISFQNNGMKYGSFGSDDEWFPMEEIEVEIEVKNDGADNVDDISVEWGLWNAQTNEWVIDIDEEDEINLKDGDKETLTISFVLDDNMDVDLSDLTDGNDYKFYVVATGTVDNATSPDTCTSDFELASIIIESNFVVIDNVEMPETVQCGQKIQVTADAWNIGDSDQNEVTVEVFGRETVLGLSETLTAGDIDAFDKAPISFTFDVPKNLENDKFYAITFQVKDEDGDVYQNDFDDEDSESVVPFKVSGNCGTSAGVGTGTAGIAASLVSGGKAGQDLVVKATITNSDTALKTYVVNAAEYGQWASSASADQNTLVLNAGQSRDVLFTIKVNDDISGQQTFYIEAVSGNEVTRQPVQVNIASKSAFGDLGNVFSGGNAAIWGIGILNLILVIVIIFVAVRVSRRK